jgi:polysaccharide export outer membrane protein
MNKLIGIFASLVFAAMAIAAVETAATSPVNPKAAIPVTEYVLQPGDVLNVQFLNEPGLTQNASQLMISQDYSITLPLIKTVILKDKTKRQAETLITTLYKGDYLVSPDISLVIVKYVDRTVSVWGPVNKPGQVSFPAEKGLNLIDAISLAGSFTRYANQRKVTLTRTKPDGKTETYLIDVKAILDGKTSAKGEQNDWPLQPNDTITVAEIVI